MSMLTSQEYYTLKSQINYFPEENINGIGIDNSKSRGIFIPPSEVTSRGDIKGMVLTAVTSEGKVQWEIAPGESISLGELTDVNLTGLNDGDVIIYDQLTNTWIPGTNSSSFPGITLSKLGNTFNVNVDNKAIGVNLLNQLQINPNSIDNSMLVNNSIQFSGIDGLNVSPTKISLGGTLNINVDNTVLRTFGNQIKNGDLEIIGTLQAIVLTDGTLTINSGNISDAQSLSLVETGGGINQITLSAPPALAPYQIVLPPTQGSANSLLLNNGTGNLSWVPSSSIGGAPGGINGSIQFKNGTSFDGNTGFTYDGTDVNLTGELSALSFNATSDAKLKKNIEPLTNCLHQVNKIRGYSYQWRTHDNEETQYGVLAQQLEEIGLKNIVNTNKKFKSVNYNELITLLIGAVNELSQRVIELERR